MPNSLQETKGDVSPFDWCMLQQYKEAGLTLTPLAAYNDNNYPQEQRGKRPVWNDWLNRGLTGKLITKSAFKGRSAGMIIGAHQVVVDVDNHNGGEGSTSLKRLKEDTGVDLLQEARITVETGGGGYHLYFSKPTDVSLVNDLKDYPGIEMKSAGRQVVIAGAMHASGKAYELAWDSAPISKEGFVPLPEVVLKLYRRSDSSRGITNTIKGEFSNANSAIKRSLEFLERVEPAVEGQGGDNRTYAIVCQLRDNGLTASKALELLLSWNETCVPPWPVGDLKNKINNAYTYAQNAPGVNTAKVEFFNDEDSTNNTSFTNSSPLSTEDAAVQEEEVKDFYSELQYTAKGTVAQNFNNTRLFLQYEDRLASIIAYNEFIHDVVFVEPAPWHNESDRQNWPVNGRRWTDHDDVHCKAYLNRFDFDPSTQRIREALVEVSKQNRIHPARDLIKSFTWDGTKRLDTWITTYCSAEDNAYVRAAGRKFLVAACTRLFEPGTKFDYLLILEGEQGTGKSTTFRVLALHDEFFIDTPPDFSSKDVVQQMMGKLLWELSELAALMRVDVNQIKSFFASDTDNVRLPYDKRPGEYKRQIIMGGTSNKTQFADDTGNRRFWPVLTGAIDIPGLRRDVEQLWAEAYHIYKQGTEKLYLDDPEASEIAIKEQEMRQLNDDWVEYIRAWIDRGGKDDFVEDAEPLDKVTGMQIWLSCLNRSASNFDRRSQGRISDAMRKLGWEKASFREHGKVMKGYRRK